jgi:uncharacterized membrane protein
MFQNRDTREVVRILARHSNLRNPAAKALYKKYSLFADGKDWRSFVPVALLAIGVALTLAGIIFFFAYNWEDLPKAAKLGMMELLMIAAACFAIFSKKSELVKNVALFAAAVLTGALFTVFGQIYQTGADAYDLFFGWGMAILIWVLVSRFAPLWLLGLFIANIVLWLYKDQADTEWNGALLFLLLFMLNALPLVILEMLRHFNKLPPYSGWMLRVVGIAAVAFLTICAISLIFDNGYSGGGQSAGPACWMFILVFFPAAIWHSYRQKELFYLSLVPLSVIVIITSLILKGSDFDSMGAFFTAGVFVIGTVSLLSYQLIQLNRKWHADEEDN